ncbi:unnamed protein product [Zymoseptoria tritici ST99CH_1A5]|uniref:Flavin reductase like domain-containing protein n=2 Tax=Zymoseptoria tritici TaxID=1047171 RepID=A0A2H1H4G3_ZYMTR|nr:unnamed protein product [Zymoseptoria tritici ST99CH_1E4]SMY29162.1 unnamed protein product [Zymoseptoria tritici ST99CH_1A5]
MSLRSGTAASRFYRAFYRWTVLSSSPSAAHGPRFTGRRAISEGAEEKKEDEQATKKRNKGVWVGKRNPAEKKISFRQNTTEDGSHSKIDDATVLSSNQEADQKSSPQTTTEASRQSSSKAISGNDYQEGATKTMSSQGWNIRTAPVQSPQELPFTALGPREQAVRHRTNAGCIVEFAVEEKALGKLQSRWGSLLEGLGRGQEVKAEVRDARTWNHASRSYLYPVIVSGPTDQVNTIKRRLVQASNYTRLTVLDKPMWPTPIKPPHSNQNVYTSKVRKQLNEEVAISICVPEAKWHNIKAEALKHETVSALPGVSFEVGTPGERSYLLCENAYLVQARDVTIVGPWDGVKKLSGEIWSVLFEPVVLSEDIDWLKITAGEYGYATRELPPGNSMPAAKKRPGTVTPSASKHKDSRPENGSTPPGVSAVFEPLGVGEDRVIRKITERARTSEAAKVPQPRMTASETADVRGTANRTSANSPSPTPISQPASEPQDLFKLVVEITAHDIWALGRALLHGRLIETLSEDSGCSNTIVSPVVFEKSPLIITSWGTQAQVASFQSRVESIAKLKAAELDLDGYGIECRTSRQTKMSKFEGEVAQMHVRAAMRSLSHPVVVITSALPAPGDFPGTGEIRFRRHRGVTVSSFTTVALSPEPIISFNLKVPSSSWEAIRKSEKMQIHLLAASPRGAAIAHAFTQPYEQPHGAFDAVRKLGVTVMSKSSATPPWLSDTHGDINYVLKAKTLAEKCVEVGDHVIVVATVTRVQKYPASLRTLTNPEGQEPDEFDGLAYASGGYRRRGASIPQSKDEEPPQDTQPVEYKPLHVEERPAPPPPSIKMVPGSSTLDTSDSAVPDPSPVRKHRAPARDNDPLTLGAGRNDHAPKRTRQPSTVPLPKFQDDDESPFISHDPIYQALRNAREAGIGEDADEGFEEAEDHNLGPERAAYRSDKSAESSASTGDDAEAAYETFAAYADAPDDQTPTTSSPSPEAYEGELNPAMQQGHDNELDKLENESEKQHQAADAEHERSKTQDQIPSNLTASKSVEPTSMNAPAFTPFGLGSFEKRSMSTAAFPRQFQSVKRFFHTTQDMHWKERRRIVKQAKEAEDRQINEVEPTARQSTVADFFNLPDDTNPTTPPRVRSLVRMKKQADRARRIMETIPERLDPQQKAEFLSTIDTHERKIARKMAWNSAKELRVMLDKGSSRVDFQKARWMEESIERGQAILVDEARRLKQQAEERSISAEDFAKERAKLEELQVVLQTEMMRLRDVVEEADGSGGDRWDDDD